MSFSSWSQCWNNRWFGFSGSKIGRYSSLPKLRGPSTSLPPWGELSRRDWGGLVVCFGLSREAVAKRLRGACRVAIILEGSTSPLFATYKPTFRQCWKTSKFKRRLQIVSLREVWSSEDNWLRLAKISFLISFRVDKVNPPQYRYENFALNQEFRWGNSILH